MTLNEAIKHCDEVSKNSSCKECATDHEQLKSWLTELKKLKNPQPYKFEDLKPNMWVWDEKENKCNKIISVTDDMQIEFYYIANDSTKYKVVFEENRFFPLTKAMNQGKEDEE